MYKLNKATGQHSMSCTGFALGAVGSACLPLGSSTTEPHSFQELSALLVTWGRKTLYSGWCHDSAPCLGRALGLLAKVLTWVAESGRSVTLCVPWSECAPSLVLQMGKATGWDYCLVTAGRNSVCQDLCAASPYPLHCHSHIPSAWAPQSPLQSLWYEIRVAAPTN